MTVIPGCFSSEVGNSLWQDHLTQICESARLSAEADWFVNGPPLANVSESLLLC